VQRGFYEITARGMRIEDLEKETDPVAGVFGDHLACLHAPVSQDPELRKAVRSMVRGKGCPGDEVFSQLWCHGIVTGDSARGARFLCDLYARYFEQHLR
jgi:hypothetical protein